ncbi:GtrA family protein [Brucella rhizosphaerae]|uniref:GtrA family protein n=1 Tax=Brucella rhizosphaerae TaxID=571254 RepID=UPI0009FF32F4
MVRTLYQIGSFGLIGLLATALHSLVFSALVWRGCDPLTSNFIAFCCAVPVSFNGNRYLTFKNRGNFAKFVVMACCGLILNHINVWIITDIVELNWKYSLPGMLVVVPIFSFFISKLWVYKP